MELVVQLLRNLPTIYGSRRFITVFTRALNWSLSWARSTHSIPSYSISLRSILILSTNLRLSLPSGLFPSGFPTNIIQWYLGIRPLWNKSNLVYVLFGREKFCLVYDLCLEYDSRRTCMNQNESWLSFQTVTSPPRHHISKHSTLLSKVKWG
jgi:hypothetical protein